MLIPKRDRVLKGMWWDRALTLVEGCTPIGAGCLHCWSAEQTAMRSKQSNRKVKERYRDLTDENGIFNGTIRMMPRAMAIPASTKAPTVFAVWNDLFHDDVWDQFINAALEVFFETPRHHFVICTKRVDRMVQFMRRVAPIANVTLMASAATQAEADDIYPRLLAMPAGWMLAASLEPLLEYIDLTALPDDGKPCSEDQKGLNALNGEFRYYREDDGEPCSEWGNRLSWVVTGCETGRNRRKVSITAIERIAIDCHRNMVPVFVKAAEIGGHVVKMPSMKGMCGGWTWYDEFPDDQTEKEQ